MGQANLAVVYQQHENKKKHPKAVLYDFIHSVKMIAYKTYECDRYYNVMLLGASQVAIEELLYRRPKEIYFHISFETQTFEFFIDKDVVIHE